MRKGMLFSISICIFIFLMSCGAIDDAIKKAQSTDTLRIMQAVGEDATFTRKRDISDAERIAEVREVFDEAEWQEMPDDDRSHPNYRIETYDVWLPDEGAYAEAQDIDSEAYTKLTGDDFEVIIQLIIDAFQ